MRLLNSKVFAQIEWRELLDLCSHTNGYNDPIDIGVFAMICGFGFSNIHAARQNVNPE
jgi:hypothetical protein